MNTLPHNSALILIDVQVGIDAPKHGARNNPDAEQNMARLLTHWRQMNRPVYHIQHMSTQPDSPLQAHLPGNAIKAIVAPQHDEPLIQKSVNSAFIGTDLEQRLRDASTQTVVLVGLVTDHCVSTTARMAGNLGFQTFVVGDATATFARTGADGTTFSAAVVHAVELASLHGEFATVVTTDQLLNVEQATE